MSKAQLKKAISMSQNLTKDIAGNVLTGNTIRAAGYIKALNHTLAELAALLEAGSDVRAEQKFDTQMQAILTQLDAEHEKVPFDKDGMDASLKKFADAGYTLPDFQ